MTQSPVAEGIVIVLICNYASWIGQLPNVAQAIISVEARCPDIVDDLVLADPLEPIHVLPLHSAADHFLKA